MYVSIYTYKYIYIYRYICIFPEIMFISMFRTLYLHVEPREGTEEAFCSFGFYSMFVAAWKRKKAPNLLRFWI